MMKFLIIGLVSVISISSIAAKAETQLMSQCRNLHERVTGHGTKPQPLHEEATQHGTKPHSHQKNCEDCKNICSQIMKESGSPSSNDFKQAQAYRLNCKNVCKQVSDSSLLRAVE